MDSDSKIEAAAEAARFGPDAIERVMRERIRDTIERLVREELDTVLGATKSARVGDQRQGYRHGTRPRTLTTSLGPVTFTLPRARVEESDGTTREWRSTIVPRYQRRTARVDAALVGVYLTGSNTRRIKGALAPLLRGGPLGKDAISRVVGRLQSDFEAWRTRDLSGEDVAYLFLDGWYPVVRIGKHRARVAILVTLAVRTTGERVVLDLRLVGQETAAGWADAIAALTSRGLRAPALAIIDGNAGLARALTEAWPKIDLQRCVVHKLRNLEAKAPVKLREEVAEDFRRMLYAETATAVAKDRVAFTKKWRLRCPAVAKSFEEAGDELFTFLRYPTAQWRALRTTNALERINEEFRRRTKTQAMLPSEDAVLLLLFGLLMSGQIRSRKLDGWQELPAVMATRRQAA
jgi:transposase-like protein